MTKQQDFDTQMQVRYEAIQAKYLPMHKEATRLYKESIAIMKPYTTRKLPCTGVDYWAMVRRSAKLKQESKIMRLEADARIQSEFWS